MEEAISLVKELMQLDNEHEVIYLHGGASTQFFQVPMNLLNENEIAAYTDTDIWGAKVGQKEFTGATVRDLKLKSAFKRIKALKHHGQPCLANLFACAHSQIFPEPAFQLLFSVANSASSSSEKVVFVSFFRSGWPALIHAVYQKQATA